MPAIVGVVHQGAFMMSWSYVIRGAQQRLIYHVIMANTQLVFMKSSMTTSLKSLRRSVLLSVQPSLDENLSEGHSINFKFNNKFYNDQSCFYTIINIYCTQLSITIGDNIQSCVKHQPIFNLSQSPIGVYFLSNSGCLRYSFLTLLSVDASHRR